MDTIEKLTSSWRNDRKERAIINECKLKESAFGWTIKFILSRLESGSTCSSGNRNRKPNDLPPVSLFFCVLFLFLVAWDQLTDAVLVARCNLIQSRFEFHSLLTLRLSSPTPRPSWLFDFVAIVGFSQPQSDLCPRFFLPWKMSAHFL